MFSQIYKWFSGLYHDNLWNFFAGYDCTQSVSLDNRFFLIGLVTLGVVVLFVLLYYFVRHAKFNSFLSWLIVLLIVAILNFCWGWGYSESIEKHGVYPDYVLYGVENCYCPVDELMGEELVSEDSEFEDSESEDLVDTESCACEQLIHYDSVRSQITRSTYVMFGLSNMIIGVLWFILISIIVKRFSVDCRNTPWKSLWPKH